MPETLMLKTQKELVFDKMLNLIKKMPFETLLSTLKIEDKRLDEAGYTECHFSRYQLVKVIEEAEGIV